MMMCFGFSGSLRSHGWQDDRTFQPTPPGSLTVQVLSPQHCSAANAFGHRHKFADRLNLRLQ
eukprot:278025-Hanusia_phi.AAC.1